MILVYLFEGNENFKDKCFNYLNEATQIIASYFLKAELLTGYLAKGKSELIEHIENLEMNFPKLELFPFGNTTSKIFAKLRNKYPNIKSPDCIHLATAIEHNADCFITNDKQLKQVKELPIIILSE